MPATMPRPRNSWRAASPRRATRSGGTGICTADRASPTEIDKALKDAEAVVVLWSPSSIELRVGPGRSRRRPRFRTAGARLAQRGQAAARLSPVPDDRARRVGRQRQARCARRSARSGRRARVVPSRSPGTSRWRGQGRRTEQARVGLRPPVHQHERRARAGIFQRRDQRGHHHRFVEGLGAFRRRAQHRLHLQGPVGRREGGREDARRHLRPRRQRPQSRQPRADHRAADRRRGGRPCLGRPLRPRPRRHFRHPGRDFEGHRRRAQDQAAARRKEGDRASRNHQCRGLQPLSDGAAAMGQRQFRRPPARRGDRPRVQAGDSGSIPIMRRPGR